MKLSIGKLIVVILSVPLFPFWLLMTHSQRSKYSSKRHNALSLSREYWGDIRSVVVYKK